MIPQVKNYQYKSDICELVEYTFTGRTLRYEGVDII
jgi:hypothetical protein